MGFDIKSVRVTRYSKKLSQESKEENKFIKMEGKNANKEMKNKKDSHLESRKRTFGRNIQNLRDTANKTTKTNKGNVLVDESCTSVQTHHLSTSTPIHTTNQTIITEKLEQQPLQPKKASKNLKKNKKVEKVINAPKDLKGLKLDSPEFSTIISPVLDAKVRKVLQCPSEDHTFVSSGNGVCASGDDDKEKNDDIALDNKNINNIIHNDGNKIENTGLSGTPTETRELSDDSADKNNTHSTPSEDLIASVGSGQMVEDVESQGTKFLRRMSQNSYMSMEDVLRRHFLVTSSEKDKKAKESMCGQMKKDGEGGVSKRRVSFDSESAKVSESFRKGSRKSSGASSIHLFDTDSLSLPATAKLQEGGRRRKTKNEINFKNTSLKIEVNNKKNTEKTVKKSKKSVKTKKLSKKKQNIHNDDDDDGDDDVFEDAGRKKEDPKVSKTVNKKNKVTTKEKNSTTQVSQLSAVSYV